jgi:1-phosphofructokinase
MSDLRAAGAETVIVSRAEQPALMSTGEQLVQVDAPRLEPLDHRGAGDSMTAGLAAGLAHGWSLESAIRLGAAAGALNVTRRGLASGEREAIEQLAQHVQLRPLELPRARPAPTAARTATPEQLAARARPAS